MAKGNIYWFTGQPAHGKTVLGKKLVELLQTEKRNWRKPDIISDAIEKIIIEDPKLFTGNQLIDEDYLRERGVVNFQKYQVVNGYEPLPLDKLFNAMIK